MKTAVEWLVAHFKKLQSEGEKMSWNQIIQITELTKEMEKEQRKKDFVNGYKSRAKESNLIFDETSEMYAIKLFNETFKSE
jgi:hypothetical protein